MEENCPSKTALRVAMYRAAHQILDEPKIFDDPLALPVLGLDSESLQDPKPMWLEETPLSRILRASLAIRSRYTEDQLHAAIKQGVDQYVVLGAGLDTFAYRNPYLQDVLHVFEVDHPATQIWKRMHLEKAGIPIPKALTFAPIDFETQSLEDGLRRAAFHTGKCTFFSWLGVTMYLTGDAIDATLRFVASMPVGSRIIFDFMIPPSLMNPIERMAFDSLAHRVALVGEPFQTLFDPSTLKNRLKAMGFQRVKGIKPEEMDALYFREYANKPKIGRLGRMIIAQA